MGGVGRTQSKLQEHIGLDRATLYLRWGAGLGRIEPARFERDMDLGLGRVLQGHLCTLTITT